MKICVYVQKKLRSMKQRTQPIEQKIRTLIRNSICALFLGLLMTLITVILLKYTIRNSLSIKKKIIKERFKLYIFFFFFNIKSSIFLGYFKFKNCIYFSYLKIYISYLKIKGFFILIKRLYKKLIILLKMLTLPLVLFLYYKFGLLFLGKLLLLFLISFCYVSIVLFFLYKTKDVIIFATKCFLRFLRGLFKKLQQEGFFRVIRTVPAGLITTIFCLVIFTFVPFCILLLVYEISFTTFFAFLVASLKIYISLIIHCFEFFGWEIFDFLQKFYCFIYNYSYIFQLNLIKNYFKFLLTIRPIQELIIEPSNVVLNWCQNQNNFFDPNFCFDLYFYIICCENYYYF